MRKTKPSEWVYVIPCAPVLLNNAYISTRTGVRIKRPEVLDFEALVHSCLEKQDQSRGKPSWSLLRCDWFMLYEPQEFYTACAPLRTRKLHPDPLVQCFDLSNSAKLAEDVVFRYFGVGDERVVDLRIHKTPVIKLPVTHLHYSDEVDTLRRGNMILRVREGTFSLPEGFDLSIVSEAVGEPRPELPTWYREMRDDLPLDLKLDYDAYASIPLSDIEGRVRTRNKLRNLRVAHAAKWLPLKDVLNARGVMRRRWRDIERKKSYTWEHWYDHPARAADLLLLESESRGLERVPVIAGVAAEAKTALVLPGGVGTALSVAASVSRGRIVVVDTAESLARCQERMAKVATKAKIEYLACDLSMSALRDLGLDRFDLLLSLDFIDLLEDPVPTLDLLSDLLRPGGTLALSYTYKTKYRGEQFPWVRASKIGTESARVVAQQHLTRKSGCGLVVRDDSSFRDDLRLLTRPL
ncbi:MAG: class I SAM-dependent methyltransferase [Hyphomicrobiaceae bacterium]|nr:MAG: class I SAM-dependent methyltransferase [Hyphomicrobiaceae bacterium]